MTLDTQWLEWDTGYLRTSLSMPNIPIDTAPIMAFKIISGGQTGVDRAALDAALANNVACGGWCPAGRRAEDGLLATRYPLNELPGAGYRGRTEQNVIDSDGTAIIYFGRLFGGSEETLIFCRRHRRPCLLVDGKTHKTGEAAATIRNFIVSHSIERLNVAGPRASDAPEAYRYTLQVINEVLSAVH